MNKLTKEEKKELRSLMEFIAFAEGSGGDTEADYDELEIWVEAKKKQWQEEAVNEYIEGGKKEDCEAEWFGNADFTEDYD